MAIENPRYTRRIALLQLNGGTTDPLAGAILQAGGHHPDPVLGATRRLVDEIAESVPGIRSAQPPFASEPGKHRKPEDPTKGGLIAVFGRVVFGKGRFR